MKIYVPKSVEYPATYKAAFRDAVNSRPRAEYSESYDLGYLAGLRAKHLLLVNRMAPGIGPWYVFKGSWGEDVVCCQDGYATKSAALAAANALAERLEGAAMTEPKCKECKNLCFGLPFGYNCGKTTPWIREVSEYNRFFTAPSWCPLRKENNDGHSR